MKRFHTASECFWQPDRWSSILSGLGQGFQPFLSSRYFLSGLQPFRRTLFLFLVGCHCFLHRFESSFPAEEFIAGSAETFENLDVHLLRSIADGFPFGLEGRISLVLSSQSAK